MQDFKDRKNYTKREGEGIMNNKPIEILVNSCDECDKDNWQHDLIELKFGKKSIWLCSNHTSELKDKLSKIILQKERKRGKE